MLLLIAMEYVLRGILFFRRIWIPFPFIQFCQEKEREREKKKYEEPKMIKLDDEGIIKALSWGHHRDKRKFHSKYFLQR